MRSKEDKIAFIANLKAGVKALEDSNMPIPNSLLESFSPKNCLAILYQRPSATNCAGFHAWRKAGRSPAPHPKAWPTASAPTPRRCRT